MQRSESLVHRQSSPIARLPLGTVSTAGRLEDLLVIMIHCWEELTVQLPTVWSKSKASYTCSAGGTQASTT